MPETLDPLSLDFSDTIARQAFRSLLEGGSPLTVSALARRAQTDEGLVTETFEKLRRAGRAEIDDDGRLVGVFGLTLRPTQHHLKLGDRQFFVWCAFDSVGIPAALGQSASVTSECAHCGKRISLDIMNGEPPDLPLVVSWSTASCESIREEFCPTINFYCDVEHYRASPAGLGRPDSFLTLSAAAELGKQNWGWAAS
jgi:alkylmercury lyase